MWAGARAYDRALGQIDMNFQVMFTFFSLLAAAATAVLCCVCATATLAHFQCDLVVLLLTKQQLNTHSQTDKYG